MHTSHRACRGLLVGRMCMNVCALGRHRQVVCEPCLLPSPAADHCCLNGVCGPCVLRPLLPQGAAAGIQVECSMLAPAADCVSSAVRRSCCAHPQMLAPAGCSPALHTRPWAFQRRYLQSWWWLPGRRRQVCAAASLRKETASGTGFNACA
jgi:hypothetical protein